MPRIKKADMVIHEIPEADQEILNISLNLYDNKISYDNKRINSSHDNMITIIHGFLNIARMFIVLYNKTYPGDDLYSTILKDIDKHFRKYSTMDYYDNIPFERTRSANDGFLEDNFRH